MWLAQKDGPKILHLECLPPIDREQAKTKEFLKISLCHIDLQLYKLHSFFELVFKERTHMSQRGICTSEKHWFGAFLFGGYLLIKWCALNKILLSADNLGLIELCPSRHQLHVRRNGMNTIFCAIGLSCMPKHSTIRF